MKFKAKTNKDRKIEVNWDRVNLYLSKWPPGTELDFEIVRRVQRKNKMRRWYFADVLPKFAHGLGYDADEYLDFHRQLKIIFFQVPKDNLGIHRKIPKVFADEPELLAIKKKEKQKKFLDWVIRKAAYEGILIEDPREA